jgi:hypothetical protein
MNLRKIIEKRVRARRAGFNIAGDVHAVIAANVGEPGSRTHVSSRSRHRVVQQGGHTVVDEHEHETEESGTSVGGDRSPRKWGKEGSHG